MYPKYFFVHLLNYIFRLQKKSILYKICDTQSSKYKPLHPGYKKILDTKKKKLDSEQLVLFLIINF